MAFRCICLYVLLLVCDTSLTPTILQRTSRPSLSNLECFTPCFVVSECCLALKDVRLGFCSGESTSSVCTRSISRLVLLITIKILIKISISSSSWSVLFCPLKAIFQSGRREGCNPPPEPLPLFSTNSLATVSPHQNKSSVLAANQNSSDNSIKRHKDVTGVFVFAGKKFGQKKRKQNQTAHTNKRMLTSEPKS